MPVVIDTFEVLPGEPPSPGREASTPAAESSRSNAPGPEQVVELTQERLAQRASRVRAH